MHGGKSVINQLEHILLAKGWVSIPPECMSSALVLALISMAIVTGLFYFHNRKIKRDYFTYWMLAWACYTVYLVAAVGLQEFPDVWWLAVTRRIFIGTSGLFVYWGCFQLTARPRTLRELAFAVGLVVVGSTLGASGLESSLWLSVVVFSLLGGVGIHAGCVYLKRRAARSGAILLGIGFILWGCHLLLFPWMELTGWAMGVSYVVSAGLALFVAFAMVVEQEETVAEKNYQLLFDSSSDAVFLVDMWNLDVLAANRAATRLTRYPLESLIGLAFPKICPGLMTRGPGNVVENQKAFKSVFRPYEEFYLLQDGGERVVCEGDAVLTEWRQRLVFQVNLRDVGEQKKLTEQIHRAEKLTALGQLVAGVAHELNNPLAIVMGKAELLSRQPQIDAAVQNDIACIKRQSERASRIVQDLLAYARPSEPNKAPMDLNRVIRDTLEWRRANCEAARITVTTKLARAMPLTKADRVQIEQVVTNLVGNAIDALRDQPLPRELEVSTELTTNFLRVCVRDNGPGIRPEIAEKIFDPFFTTKPLGQGTGLGLTISNTYIQEHRGKIWVDSKPGKGTSFFFDLPLVECDGRMAEEPETRTSSAAAPAAVTGGQRRLLIIDDEPDIRQVLETVLVEDGFHITTASNGNEALQILSNQNFDVILSDIRMPDLDGQALYQRIHATKPALAQRVIFVTGDTVSGKTREFLDSTGNLWISKPFRITDVVNRVQELLRLRPAVASGGPSIAASVAGLAGGKMGVNHAI
jgi:PAS domain S-box-containing protein